MSRFPFGRHLITPLLCLVTATVEASDLSVDAVMKKIFAVYGGTFHGEVHYRGVADESDWTTSDQDVTCTQSDTWTGSCVGKTGGSEWVARYRYNSGIISVDGETDGTEWSIQYVVVDPWYFDSGNFGFTRKWTSVNSGVEYEGEDEIVQMGKRGIIQRKVRKSGSDEQYRFTGLEVVDRLE